MDALSWTRKRAMCIGKEAFTTPQLANKVQKRRAKKRSAKRFKQEVYRCECCGFFHIGTKAKSRQAPRRKPKDWGAEEEDDTMI